MVKGNQVSPAKGIEKRGREISNGRPSNHEAFFLSIRYNRKPPASSHVSTSTVSSQISSDTCDGRFFQVREEEWKKEEEKCSSSSSPYRVRNVSSFRILVSFHDHGRNRGKYCIMEYTWYIQNERKNSLDERKKKKEICTHGTRFDSRLAQEPKPLAAYLRNAPPAYECKPMTGALPSLSHPFPSRCSFDPRLAQRHDGERGRARHAQPRAVYPQSIKDDRQHEYQQRRQLPAAGHGIARFCNPLRQFTLRVVHARARYREYTRRCCIPDCDSHDTIGFSKRLRCIEIPKIERANRETIYTEKERF